MEATEEDRARSVAEVGQRRRDRRPSPPGVLAIHVCHRSEIGFTNDFTAQLRFDGRDSERHSTVQAQTRNSVCSDVSVVRTDPSCRTTLARIGTYSILRS